MKSECSIGSLNPVDVLEVHKAMEYSAFDELRDTIVATPRDQLGGTGDPFAQIGSANRPLRRASIALVAIAAVTVLVVGLFAVGDSESQDLKPTHVASAPGQGRHGGHLLAGTWRTLDAALTGEWQQNTSGPPSGYIACPRATICYQMSGHYPSAIGGAPLLYESFDASSDAGTTWTEYRMPSGFAPTSPISCGGPSSCSAGGTYGDHSVMITTDDGGRSFSTFPLPTNVGAFVTMTCTAIHECSGLAASRLHIAGNSGATFLATADGGSTFTDHPIIAGDSMEALSCSSSLDCTAVGTSDAAGAYNWTPGAAARTIDGGRTWTTGSLPGGFGISQGSQVSCGDARHCSVTGNISIDIPNSPQCASFLPLVGAPTTTVPQSTPSAAVQAIAQAESRIASAASLKSSTLGSGFVCNPGGHTLIGDVSSTVDGGITWSPDALPEGIPQPMFTGISCPTANECWAAGESAVPQTVGTSSNGGSSMLLGTTDGGQSWSPVSFSIPEGAPNYDGQSYISFGFITCPAAHACFANGATAQGSPTAPFYTLTHKARRY
jgi:photosystem II stability/assembly factor-like uncharacterized protein